MFDILNSEENDTSLDFSTVTGDETLSINGDTVEVPHSSFIRDADFSREGTDLVLETNDGSVTIEGYFAQETPPMIEAPDGTALSPALVNSFLTSGSEYAQYGTVVDESPVGSVHETSGEVTVTRTDGTIEEVSMGTPIYEGDIIETDGAGAANIVFIDETSFAVSENARLSIDEYVFDPATNEGSTDFSILKGIFVFTSGLIGREDPDDVTIDTPMGSIGIRGTQILGNVDTGEITVTEGAIVLRDFQGHEVTLEDQFETATFKPGGEGITHDGIKDAQDVLDDFASVQGVAGDQFAPLQDAADNAPAADEAAPDQVPEEAPAETQEVQDGELEQQSNMEIQQNNVDVVGEYASQQLRAGQTRHDGSLWNGNNNSTQNINATSTTDSSEATNNHRNNMGQDNHPYNGDSASALNDGGTAGISNLPEGAAPLSYFKFALGTAGLDYDFANQFYDLQGDYSINITGPDNYSASSLSAGTLTDLSGLTTAGEYTVHLVDTDISADTTGGEDFTFDLEVVAPDYIESVGTVDNITLGSFEGAGSIGMLTGATNIFFDTATTINIFADGKYVFSNADAAITTNGDNNFIYGDDDDASTSIFTLNDGAAGNTVFGGRGDDTFNFNVNDHTLSNGNKMYGLDGEETFTITDVQSKLLQELEAGEDIQGTLMDGGNGRDTLVFEGAGHTFGYNNGDELDFSKMAQHLNHVKNIEVIDIYDGSSTGNPWGEKIVLNYNNVFDMTSEENDHELTIKADQDDTVDLHGSWVEDTGNSYDEFGDLGAGYTQYTNGAVTVLVDATATVNVIP